MRRILIATFVGCLVSATAAQSAPHQGADAPENASGNPDKVVCKRFVRIGSLVDGYRTCKTKKEWERERENVRTVNWTNPCASAQTGNCDGS
jgi:hypothetical protein